MNKCGIYAILCNVNNKKYYGSTNNWEQRRLRHLIDLKNNKHFNIYLQHAWNKYGETSFSFIWIEDVDRDKLLEIEQKYISDNIDGFNINPIANLPPSRLGCYPSDETRKKMGETAIKIGRKPPSFKNKKRSEKFKNKLRIANIGKKLSKETKEKIRLHNINKKLSIEHIKKIVQTKRNKYSQWPGGGQKNHIVSQDTKNKISKKLTTKGKGYTKVGNRWRVTMRYQTKRINGGYFDTEIEAQNKIRELRKQIFKDD